MTLNEFRDFYGKFGDASHSADNFYNWLSRTENSHNWDTINRAYSASRHGSLGTYNAKALQDVLDAFYNSDAERLAMAKKNYGDKLYNSVKWGDYINYVKSNGSTK